MGPQGAYLNFVLYIIPYPEHHNPKDSLAERERERQDERGRETGYKWKGQTASDFHLRCIEQKSWKTQANIIFQETHEAQT